MLCLLIFYQTGPSRQVDRLISLYLSSKERLRSFVYCLTQAHDQRNCRLLPHFFFYAERQVNIILKAFDVTQQGN